MRAFASTLALPLLAGSAVAAEPSPVGREDPAALPAATAPDEQDCRDTITTVRAERSLPPLELQRENASPDEAEALMVLAVDREIDGCDVLVMAANPRDVRPLPRFEEQDWRVRPAAPSARQVRAQ